MRGGPLRSLMLGDCDRYLSPYIFGVGQAVSRLGHWHSTINIRQSTDVIAQRIRDMKPHILWTHMLLWAPPGSPPLEKLLGLMEATARGGTQVVIHDGDYKEATRHPEDISSWCALALCNHEFDRSAWRVRPLLWPYFAFAQDGIAPRAASELRGCLWFAGSMGAGPVYGARSAQLEALRASGVALRMPSPEEGNTLCRTAEIASSADGVLGFGRPGAGGWVDTRVFQYPGAGGILIHDDVAGYLEPYVHFLPYESNKAESVVRAWEHLHGMSHYEQWALRERAFAFVQQNHSSVARVRQVLQVLELERA